MANTMERFLRMRIKAYEKSLGAPLCGLSELADNPYYHAEIQFLLDAINVAKHEGADVETAKRFRAYNGEVDHEWEDM